MGKLLLDDVLSTVTTPFDERGARTGKSPTNPAQFQNFQTGWLDASTVFGLPTPYEVKEFPDNANGLLSGAFPSPNVDEGQKALRVLFARRYNQLFNFWKSVVPCNNGCSSLLLARCVREITILEYQAVAREFLSEAKKLYLGPTNNLAFATDNSFVTPVDLAGAKLLDLHYGPARTTTACSPPTPTTTGVAVLQPSDNPALCLNDTKLIGLHSQRASATLAADVQAAMNRIKQLGLGSLNSYLSKLKPAPLKLYSALGDNLLNDIRGSDAEYAINFGILEAILAQDSKATATQVNNTCISLMGYTGTNLGTWVTSLKPRITAAPTRTLCSLIKEMNVGAYGTTYSNNLGTNILLHANMFRVPSAGTPTGNAQC
jgi:hypothetical protein